MDLTVKLGFLRLDIQPSRSCHPLKSSMIHRAECKRIHTVNLHTDCAIPATTNHLFFGLFYYLNQHKLVTSFMLFLQCGQCVHSQGPVEQCASLCACPSWRSDSPPTTASTSPHEAFVLAGFLPLLQSQLRCSSLRGSSGSWDQIAICLHLHVFVIMLFWKLSFPY